MSSAVALHVARQKPFSAAPLFDAPLTLKGHRLLLHMDINKTIIQTDAAGGRTLEDVLNSNAAANVFGTINERSGKWEPLYGPYDEGVVCPNVVCPDGAITYDAYIDNLYTAPEGMQEMPLEKRREIWRGVTDKRKAAVKGFTLPGGVGESYASLVDQQRECLTVDAASGTLHSIIPSFFQLVNYLSEMEWPFTVLFRTFGSDLDVVLQEWQRFVAGEHVCKPRGALLEAMRVPSVAPLKTAGIYRLDHRLFLCRGIQSFNGVKPGTSVAELQSWIHSQRGGEGDEVGLIEVTASNFSQTVIPYFLPAEQSDVDVSVGGLMDFYPHWASGAELRHCGKVFPVEFNGASKGAALPVFFDDNIFIGDQRSIVDLRDAATGASVCGREREEPFCVAVNAFKAIVDPDYFIKELQRCLLLQAQQHQCPPPS